MTKAEKTEAPTPITQPEATSAHPQVAVPVPVDDNNIPLMSMIFGVVGLATFMLFLGIPALVLGIIGLRKYPTNRGFSIAGIITGILSMLGMLAFIAFFVLIIAADGFSESGSDFYDSQYDHRYDSGQRFDRSQEGV